MMTELRLSKSSATTVYDRLCDFYSLLLAQPRASKMTPPPSNDPDEPSRICFFNYYSTCPTPTHRDLRMQDIGSGPTSKGCCTIFQLRTRASRHLVDLYGVLKDSGELPEETSNHGPGTSFYYRDPDVTRSSCPR